MVSGGDDFVNADHFHLIGRIGASFFRQINVLLVKVGQNLRSLLYNLGVLSPIEGDVPQPSPCQKVDA